MGDISSMSNEQLRNELSTSGLGSIPAITSSTRKIYEKKLASLRAEKGGRRRRETIFQERDSSPGHRREETSYQERNSPPVHRRREISFQERDSSPGRRREEPRSLGYDSSSASSRREETSFQERDSSPGHRREEPRSLGYDSSSSSSRLGGTDTQERDSSPGRRRRETNFQERDSSPESSRYREFENQEYTRYRYRQPPLQYSGLPSPHTFLNQIRSQQSSTPKSRPWNARVKWITGRVISKLGLIAPIVVILVVLGAFYYTASPVFPVALEDDDGPTPVEREYFDDI